MKLLATSVSPSLRYPLEAICKFQMRTQDGMPQYQFPVFKSLRSKKNGVLEYLRMGHFTPYGTLNADIFTETYLSRSAFPDYEVSITIIES